MTVQHASNSPAASGWLTTLGWAAYLACSWTWCIGMFLPVLLVRDYGIWGFVVFAVPNVVGAAAMGWVLRDKTAVSHFLVRHRSACVAFSIITVAFQAYFAIFIVHAASDFAPLITSGDRWQTTFLVFLACTLPALIVLVAGDRAERWCATAVWLVSAVVGIYLVSSISSWDEHTVTLASERAAVGLAFLAPVCIFGFAFCPYLDLTFLKAASDQNSVGRRASFTIGFGILFLAMILLTLVYTPLFIRVANGTSAATDVPRLLLPVLMHMTAQLSLTIALHAKEAARAILPTDHKLRWAVILVSVIIAGALWGVASKLTLLEGVMTSGEIAYRVFMSFYGLVFPAYVWLCMIPTPDGHSGIDGPLGRRKLVVLGFAVLLAAPCFWMGFIERVEWWLAPGLGVVLVARLFVRGTSPVSVPA